MPKKENVPEVEAEEFDEPTFDESGKLTLSAMRREVENGRAVMIDGRHITSLDDLPSEAELAAGDPVKSARVREALLAQQEAIQRQLAMLPVAEEAPAEVVPLRRGRPPGRKSSRPTDAEPTGEAVAGPDESPSFGGLPPANPPSGE